MLNRNYLILFFITFLLFSCDENTDSPPANVDGFNRTELLEDRRLNHGTNFFISAFDKAKLVYLRHHKNQTQLMRHDQKRDFRTVLLIDFKSQLPQFLSRST